MNGRGRVENVRRHSIEAVQRPVGSRVSHHVSVLCLLEPIAAGAAIVHLHAREPKTGRPDQTPEAFARFFAEDRARWTLVVRRAGMRAE